MERVVDFVRAAQACALFLTIFQLSACGGGGGGGSNGNVKSTPPPPEPTITQPPNNVQLTATHADAAHAAGYTGSGVIIAVVDSGVMREQPSLSGRVIANQVYVDATTNNVAVDDAIGHGTYVAEIAAGRSFGQFAGGIATGAQIVSARILVDQSSDKSPVSPINGALLQNVNQNLINVGAKVMNNSWVV